MRLRSSRSQSGFTLVELLVVVAIIAILVALLLPAVQAAREAARRAQCSNNFKQVGLALHNYHSSHSKFPPGMIMLWPGGCPNWPRERKIGWGWGTFILPYLEQDSVYREFDFQVIDYGSSGSREVGGTRVDTFICSTDPNSEAWVECCSGWSNGPRPTDDFRMSNVVGVGDSRNIWCGSDRSPRIDGNGMLFNYTSVRVAHVTDGTSHTLLVGEITGAQGRHPSQGPAFLGYFWVTWGIQDTALGINGPLTLPGGRNDTIDPVDGDGGNRHDEMFSEIGFCSWHPGGAHFTFADGSVHFLSENINQPVLEAITTRAGEEVVDPNDY